MKLNLALISSDRFPPYRVDLKVLFGKEITSRGHSVDLLLQSADRLPEGFRTRWSGCDVWVGGATNEGSCVGKLLNNLFRAFQDFRVYFLAQKRKYDCIIVRDKFLSAIIPLLIAKIVNLKFVFWLSYPIVEDWIYQVQTGTAQYPLIYWLRGASARPVLYSIVMRFSDYIFVTTSHMLENVLRKGIPKNKIGVVPMAVPPTDIPFFHYKTTYFRGKGPKSIVYIGSLNRHRRMDFLLRVFSKVKKREKNIRLILVGGGDYESDVRFLWDEAAKLKISNSIIITGLIPQREVWGYAKDAFVCVSPIFPSPILNCGMPTKILEYMAMGKAVVGNDQPEQRRILLESKAGICIPYDEDAFACAILHLFCHPEETVSMGIKGREYVMKHANYEQVADLVENKLLEICGRRVSESMTQRTDLLHYKARG
jgi:glycosyltransferase involved in cell wall biosynthesis